MDIAKLNERIMIQKYVVCKDAIGNHWNEWKDYFSCSAYASTFTADEQEGSPETSEKRTITFTIRWCSEVSCLTSTQYRVLFHGDVYDIESVDPMNYGRKSMKLKCSFVPKRGDAV